MSQQTNNTEKNIAEGSAALGDQEAVSIMSFVIFYLYCIYLPFIFIFRIPAPILLRMMKEQKEQKEQRHPPSA